MAMGLSSTTPKHHQPFWVSHSRHRFSKNALLRREICTIYGANGLLVPSLQIKRYSSCETRSGASRFELQVLPNTTNPSQLSAQMVPTYRYPNNSHPPGRDNDNVNLSPTAASPTSWQKEIEKLRGQKMDFGNVSANRYFNQNNNFSVTAAAHKINTIDLPVKVKTSVETVYNGNQKTSLDNVSSQQPYSRNISISQTKVPRKDTHFESSQSGAIDVNGNYLSTSNDKILTKVPIKGPHSEQSQNGATYANEKHQNSAEKIETKVVQVTTDVHKMLSKIYEKVLVVDSISDAKNVVERLTHQYKNLIYACDTEVAKIDVKQETPVDHGEIICFSIYGGPDVDFGNGKSCIWVDVLDGGGKDILVEFAPFFEDPAIKKVWHNYSFDNHVVENYGIKLGGFHADTMHMARLWDSSRRTQGGYSLEALTGNKKVMSIDSKKDMSIDSKHYEENLIGKISMKTIFGKRKIKKDGSEGKIVTIPPVEELQKNERKPWISYSALDSMSTLKLYESLKFKLEKKEWRLNGDNMGNMFDFYESHWRPFGELLVKMETEGMLVDREYLSKIEKVAIKEQQVAANRFRIWASRYCPDSKLMNVGSDAQLRQLLFGGTVNSKDPTLSLPLEKTFKVPNVNNVIAEGKKTPLKFCDLTIRSINKNMSTEIYTATGWPSVSGDALKTLAGKVSSDYDCIGDPDMQPDDDVVYEEEMNGAGPQTEKSTENDEIDKSGYGTAYKAFGGGHDGMEACHAIAALCEVCSIDSLISNFILPLQGSQIAGKNGRVHCSLNINTETGRLSARRPNLQNQPALEKDRYKIRQAFIAAPGNSLIVADYGQLELRILAHLANCKSMLDAFKAGGDFHSRTAMNMYPHIREAVDQKQVLLEWEPQPGQDKPPVPLLKDAFASERRKAKMLNFSIAYGKTPVGLSRDWKVSVKEAKKTVELWYKERKEVLKWQEIQKASAREKQCVHTLLGRARLFPSLVHASNAQKGHVERAAINTPVQGSAADVAMCAMLEISKNERLKELGWTLLLQVHDEVILEGPTETAEVAKAIVVDCMAKPFDGKNILNVDLSVDAKFAQNWYSAK